MFFFFFNDTATTEIYTLSLHDALPIFNYQTGETVVLIRRHKRRREIAELLEALLEKHPTGTVYVAWDNSNTHEDDEVEAVPRGAAAPPGPLYSITFNPSSDPHRELSGHF